MDWIKNWSPTLAFSLALLLLSGLGTLAAFGGKTWIDDDRPLLRRITRRGWISLLCLTLAIGVGIVKNLDEGRAAFERRANEDAKTRQLNDLQIKLGDTGAKLATAEGLSKVQLARIDELNDMSGRQVKTLDAQSALLVAQSEAIKRAHEAVLWSYDNSKENANSALIATVLNDKSVDQVTLRLTADRSVMADTIGGVFFPNVDATYADIAKIRVHARFGGRATNRTFGFTDSTTTLPPLDDRIGAMRFEIDKATPDAVATLNIDLPSQDATPYMAISAYRDLAQRRIEISVFLVLEQEFPSEAAVKAYVQSRPDLLIAAIEPVAAGSVLARFAPTQAMMSSVAAPSWRTSCVLLPISANPGAASRYYWIQDDVERRSTHSVDGLILALFSTGEPRVNFR